jgi:RHS repeat-associated protein
MLRRYVPGGPDSPLVWYEGATLTSKRFFHADAPSTGSGGSIIATSDSTGAASQTYSYGPYGEPSTATGSRFKYTGQITLPGVGLHYYKARMYSPLLGRFLQPDPIGVSGGMNIYGYTGGDPVNRKDQSGKAPGDIFFTELGAAKDAINYYYNTVHQERIEYGGFVNASNWGWGPTYSYSAVSGRNHSVEIGSPLRSGYWQSTAMWHIHPSVWDPSLDDMKSVGRTHLNSYIGMPNGVITRIDGRDDGTSRIENKPPEKGNYCQRGTTNRSPL